MDEDQVKPDSNGQGNDDPKYVDEKALNKAITQRLAAFEKKQKEIIAEALNSLAPTLDTLLEQKLATVKQEMPKNKPQVEEDPKYKGLEKQLIELKQKADAAEQRAVAEAAKAKESTLRQKLSDELAKYGIDAARARYAVGTLVDADKRVRWSEDDPDMLVFRDSDGTEIDLSSGVKSWAKSDEAKIFLPPRGTSGSGERPGGKTNASKQTGMSREDIGNDLAKLFGRG